jgi:hypothetical protein
MVVHGQDEVRISDHGSRPTDFLRGTPHVQGGERYQFC